VHAAENRDAGVDVAVRRYCVHHMLPPSAANRVAPPQPQRQIAHPGLSSERTGGEPHPARDRAPVKLPQAGWLLMLTLVVDPQRGPDQRLWPRYVV
jgi:hypothetical protein